MTTSRFSFAPPRQGHRHYAELARQPHADEPVAGRVVDGGARIVEAVGAAHLLHRVRERLDLGAPDLSRPVDVPGAVQHVHLDLPRLRQGGGLRDDRIDGRRRLRCDDGHDHERKDRHQRCRGRRDDDKPSRRIHAERARRHRQPCELSRLSPVDVERGAEQERGFERVLDRREPIDAALLEPLDLLWGQARALRGLLQRQTALESRQGERRAAGRHLLEPATRQAAARRAAARRAAVARRRVGVGERAPSGSTSVRRGSGPEPLGQIPGPVDVARVAEVVARHEERPRDLAGLRRGRPPTRCAPPARDDRARRRSSRRRTARRARARLQRRGGRRRPRHRGRPREGRPPPQ